MAGLDNLPQLISENPQARGEFVSLLVDFCKRYGIDTAPEDFVGLSNDQSLDASGHALPLTGVTGASVANTGTLTGGLEVFIYRDGPHTSRWIWSG